VDSDSESEDFSCKKSKQSLSNNNNNDVTVGKQSKVKPLDNKRSCSGTAASSRQLEDNKQHVSASANKAEDSMHKLSKGKKIKDEVSALNGPSTKESKSKSVNQKVILFLSYFQQSH